MFVFLALRNIRIKVITQGVPDDLLRPEDFDNRSIQYRLGCCYGFQVLWKRDFRLGDRTALVCPAYVNRILFSLGLILLRSAGPTEFQPFLYSLTRFHDGFHDVPLAASYKKNSYENLLKKITNKSIDDRKINVLHDAELVKNGETNEGGSFLPHVPHVHTCEFVSTVQGINNTQVDTALWR